MPTPELLFAFFFIAAAYASAGFGGGSSYLAVLAVAGFSMAEMRPAALVCNIVVTAGGALVFWQKGLLDGRRTWPLFASVPAAWLAARWPISEPFFFDVLGSALIGAGLLMAFQKEKKNKTSGLLESAELENPISNSQTNEKALALEDGSIEAFGMKKPFFLAFLGILLGILAGLTGIGGGVFLAPALHFMRFDEPKKIAATASVFILANSAAGLLGQVFSKNWAVDWALVGPLALAVAVGGQLGSRLSANFLQPREVRWATAALVLYAGFSVWQKLF